jgi:hypothetical protein
VNSEPQCAFERVSRPEQPAGAVPLADSWIMQPPDMPPASVDDSCEVDLGRETINVIAAGRLGSWHLPAGQSLSDLCETLNNRGVTYVVLPPVSASWESKRAGLLVRDEHISLIRDLITRKPLGQQLAIYSVTDLPGFTFQQHWRYVTDATNMAVLPPFLAEALLAGARLDERGARVPATEDLLLWEIYRALYLSGNAYFAPGPGNGRSPILIGPSAQSITDLGRKTAAHLLEPLTLETLDRHLAASGWEPPYDVLRRLSPWNNWAASKVRRADAKRPIEEPGMVVFFVRQAVRTNGLEADVARIIETTGFELLKTFDLDEEQLAVAAQTMRGGNWGPGACPVSGGPPVSIIICHDVLPTSVPDNVRRLYPHLDNGHILDAKLRCRELIQDRLPRDRRFNPVHSTDDSGHAWEVIRMFAAEDEQALRDTVELRKAAMVTHFEVVRDLTRLANRSKIEVIRYGGGLAVKKTYRHTCLRFLEREAAFMDTFSPHRPEILPVLERGPNYLITPFVEARPSRYAFLGRKLPRLMSLREVRNAADLLRFVLSKGYDPVDLGPHNLLVDRSGRLTAIDFEFVHRTDKPIDPEQSACLCGIPKDFEGEWPPKALWLPKQAKSLDPWRLRWFACTGLSLRSFLYDPPWLQRIKRVANYPAYLGSKAIQHNTRWLRDRAKQGLRRRLPALTRMVVSTFRSRAIRS